VTRKTIRDRNVPDPRAFDAWLLSEAANDPDAGDEPFAQLFGEVLKVEPAPDFVARTVVLVQARQAERRRRAVFGWAAGLAAMAACAIAAYLMLPSLAPLTMKLVVLLASRGVPWLVAFTGVALDWWWTVGRVGGSVAAALATPARAGVIIGVELIGILAFLAIQKLTRGERLGDAQV
jgi:hypothetical protein